jgi:hypothetical protein
MCFGQKLRFLPETHLFILNNREGWGRVLLGVVNGSAAVSPLLYQGCF